MLYSLWNSLGRVLTGLVLPFHKNADNFESSRLYKDTVDQQSSVRNSHHMQHCNSDRAYGKHRQCKGQYFIEEEGKYRPT